MTSLSPQMAMTIDCDKLLSVPSGCPGNPVECLHIAEKHKPQAGKFGGKRFVKPETDLKFQTEEGSTRGFPTPDSQARFPRSFSTGFRIERAPHGDRYLTPLPPTVNCYAAKADYQEARFLMSLCAHERSHDS